MVAKLVIAVSFIVLAFTVVDASAFSSGSKRNSGEVGGSTNNIVQVPEPTSIYALASGVLLLGGAAWLVRRK